MFVLLDPRVIGMIVATLLLDLVISVVLEMVKIILLCLLSSKSAFLTTLTLASVSPYLLLDETT